MALLLAFLFVTQRELFSSAIGQLGALGGGAAAVVQLLSEMRSGRRSE